MSNRRIDNEVWDAQPFGHIPDREIARRLGCNEASVRAQRNKRGIAPHSKELLDWSVQPLGKMPDTRLAAQLGCNVGTVARQRKKRGIPKYKK